MFKNKEVPQNKIISDKDNFSKKNDDKNISEPFKSNKRFFKVKIIKKRGVRKVDKKGVLEKAEAKTENSIKFGGEFNNIKFSFSFPEEEKLKDIKVTEEKEDLKLLDKKILKDKNNKKSNFKKRKKKDSYGISHNRANKLIKRDNSTHLIFINQISVNNASLNEFPFIEAGDEILKDTVTNWLKENGAKYFTIKENVIHKSFIVPKDSTVLFSSLIKLPLNLDLDNLFKVLEIDEIGNKTIYNIVKTLYLNIKKSFEQLKKYMRGNKKKSFIINQCSDLCKLINNCNLLTNFLTKNKELALFSS